MIQSSIFEHGLRALFAPVQPLLDDRSVSEVMINGPNEVFVERRGCLERTQVRFESAEALHSALRLLAQFVGRPLGDEHPILEARLPDGSRVEAIVAPVAPDGPHVAIRRFREDRLTLAALLEAGSLNSHAAELLRALVEVKQNVVVAGGTGTGKTSLLNVLSSFIPSGDRVLVLEDSRELQLRGEHVVQLETRPRDSRGRGGVSIRDLFKASLRMRPDRIVVGEIRDGAALDLIQAMTSGHGGCMATLHATHPRDAMARMETMALMADVDLPLSALRAQLCSAVDVIVQVDRLRAGARVVSHIAQVGPLDGHGRYRVEDIYTRRGAGADGPGQLEATGVVPSCAQRLALEGVALPHGMSGATRGGDHVASA